MCSICTLAFVAPLQRLHCLSALPGPHFTFDKSEPKVLERQMMFVQLWLVATALPAVVLGGGDSDVYFTGDGTANAVGQAAAGACNAGIGDNYAALNADQWNVTLNCGKCVEVECDDDRCSSSATPVTVYIVDQCSDCEDEGLDLSLAVFKTVTGNDDPSRHTIKWEFVACPTDGQTSFETLKSSNGNTYQAGTVEAANKSLKSVSILQENEKEVEKTSKQDESDKANTESGDAGAASGISTFLVVLGVLAAICGVALAAVGFSYLAKKRKLNRKHDDFTTQTFDTFSSPAQAKAAIVKI